MPNHGSTSLKSGTDLAAPTIFVVAILGAALAGLHIGAGRSPMIPFAVLALLAIGVAVMRQPALGLIGIVVMLIANVSDNLIVYFGFPSVNQLLAPALALLVAYRWLFDGERPFIDIGILAAVFIFMLMTYSGVLYAYDYSEAMAHAEESFKSIILILIVSMLFSIRNSIDTIFDTILIIAFLICSLGVYKYSFGDINSDYYGFAQGAHNGSRFSGPVQDPNAFGRLLVCLFPFAVDRALWGQRLASRVFGMLTVLFTLVCIVLTESRGALLSLVISVSVYTLSFGARTSIRIAAAAVAAGLVGASFLTEDLAARFASIIDMAGGAAPLDRAVEGRLGSWAVAVHLFFENPLLGVGAGNFNALYQDTANELGLIFRGQDRSPHSLYLEILSEHGAIGLALFLGVVGLAARGILVAMAQCRAEGDERGRSRCAALGAALAGYLAAMAFLHNPSDRVMWLLFSVSIALPRLTTSAPNVAEPEQSQRSELRT